MMEQTINHRQRLEGYWNQLFVIGKKWEEDKKLCEDIKQFRANEKNFSAEEFRVRCQKRAAEKAERERKTMEALMDIRNEPLFAGL